MNVLLFDLKEQYRSIKNEINAAITRVLESGIFILGSEVASLEEEAAKYLGCKFAVGVASGTDALTLSLKACGVGKGDEVITTPFTFVATVEAIIHSGATPVFVDICSDTFNIDAAKIEDKISKSTRAILPVHMYGQSADMDEIMQIAAKHDIRVIDDAAQGFGAEYKGRKTGTSPDMGCFSFFPTKNLGAYGDAGMIVTDDEDLAEKARMLRVHGGLRKYEHDVIGYNSRLDALQAAVLRVKLQYVDRWNDARRGKAALYNELLKGADIITPVEKDCNKHIYHQYTVRVKNRKECRDYLREKGIATAVHYPKCVCQQNGYQFLNYKMEEFPVSLFVTKEVFSFPMYPELMDNQISYVCGAIREFLKCS